MKETNIQQTIRLSLSKIGFKMYRNNVGGLYDINGRWVSFGLKDGSADLIGFSPRGIFTSVEVKTPVEHRYILNHWEYLRDGNFKKGTKQYRYQRQIWWHDSVNQSGGLGFFASCPKEIIRNIKKRVDNL